MQTNNRNNLKLKTCAMALSLLISFPHLSFAQASNILPSNVSWPEVLQQTKRTPDKVISYGEDPLQFGQLWLPSKAPKIPSPLIVFIHGGCWLNAYDIAHTNALSYRLAQAGFAVWSLEYRRTGDKGGAWPGSYEDILQGIEHTGQLSQYKVNSEQVIIMGHSAGGHLALLSGNALHNKKDSKIVAVIGLAAISDLTKYSKGKNSCQTATPQFMQGNANDMKPQYQQANPMAQGFHPRTILIHGDQDNIVPLAQSTNTGQQVKVVKGAGHFDMVHTDTKAWDVILATLNQFAGNK